MAPLLMEGMGDTLRVSLTEAPENELPVARTLTELFPKPAQLPYSPFQDLAWDPFSFKPRRPGSLKIISPDPPDERSDLTPESIIPHILALEAWEKDPVRLGPEHAFLLLERNQQGMQELKYRLNRFCQANAAVPVLYKTVHHTADPELFMMQLAGELGFLLIDGALDAVWVENPRMETEQINEILLMILQATGARITKTEYIACPSCGRTQFDMLSRLQEIREATSHLSGLKIGVMGCIVNGPGEMADSHYGYVGAGPGKVSLYKGKTEVRKHIPEKQALQALIRLMKEEGDWRDP
jgi:(E)-4-hydroxy-3-methylbut-2-enyl-diphosphate synthase